MINLNNIARQIQILLLAIITLAIFFSSFKSMRANAWYFNAKNTLQELTVTGYSEKELNLAAEAINLASILDPAHPHYLQLNAHIKMLKLALGDVQSDTVLITYQQVEQLLLQSLSMRKTWAETWIALAQVVSYQEGPTERVYDYIQEAKKVGPYKLNVQFGVIQIALLNWKQLPPKFKALYVNELRLAVKYGSKFNHVFRIAKQVEALPILCLSLQFGTEFEQVRSSYIFKKHCK